MVGLYRLLVLQAQRLAVQAPTRQVLPIHKGDRRAVLAGAPSAADAVHVGHGVFGALIVNNVGDVVDVDTTGGHVGSYQHIHLAVTQGTHGLLAGALTQVTMQRGHGETLPGQLPGDRVGSALGAAENNAAFALAGLQNAADNLHLVHGVHAVGVLGYAAHCEGVVCGIFLGPNMGGLVHVAPGQGNHCGRHGGAKEHGLAVGAGGGQDLFHVGQEPQVKHFVCLVKHHGGDVV